ncbi:MAG: PAS domain S-box protein [Spirochaetes bacterium]|nr:PAS domain S-box protein [Spirochaetota bacterium]
MQRKQKPSATVEQLLEEIPSALVLIDQDEKVLFYNEEAKSLFQGPNPSASHRNYLSSNTIRLGDLISCKNRTLNPKGCGFSSHCPACEFFQLIRFHCRRLGEAFRVSGIAQVFRDRDPSSLWFRYTARSVPWKETQALAISFEDFTFLKEKEEELDVRRAHFEHLFQHAPIAIAILDEQDRFLDCNLQFMELFQYSIDEIRGKPINDLIVPKELKEEASAISKAVLSGTAMQVESVRQRKDGTQFPVSIMGAPITIRGRGYVYALYQDITVRKEMERKVLALLKEKDLILKEVHHRIKNNMALIISLLNMERYFLKDKDAIKALETAEGRIRSMEVLYDKLYRSETIRSVSMQEYLESLVKEIVSFFPKRAGIHTILKIPPIEVDPKTLSTLGLIINELITNSMKYAFTDQESGSISIEIGSGEDGLRIRYEDDGAGLPKGFTLEQSEGFGLQLVTLLTEQLGGIFQIEKSKGACFVFQIPYPFHSRTLGS